MKKLLILSIFFYSSLGFSQLTVTNNQTIEWYIQNVLIGTGVTISNVQYNAGAGNIVNAQVGQFTDPNGATGLGNGLIMGSGDVTMAAQPNTGGGSTLGGGTGNGVDTDLASLTLNQINDECIIEFDFVPTGDSLVFSYVFASEEYEEYVCGSVNDAFGFFLTGTNPNGANYAATNLALVPDPANPAVYTTTGVSINTVNPGVAGGSGTAANCAALDPNWASYNIFYAGANTTTDYEYDGNTVVLDCRAAVVCGETYHIKLGIGDGGDGAFDSGVFLEGGSFSSPQPVVEIRPIDENGDPIPNGNLPEGCIQASILLIKPAGYTDSVYVMDLDISGTAINGTDYTQLFPNYTIPAGTDTLEIVLDAFLDGITEGNETLILSTFFITNCGDSIFVIDTLNILDVATNYNLIMDDITIDCPEDLLFLEVSADGGIPNIDYSWLTTGETTSSIWVPGNVVGTTYYPVLATDYCGITSLDSVAVTLNFSVIPTIDFVEDDILTCVGPGGLNLAVLNVNNPFDVDSVTYDWSPTPSDQNFVTVFPIASSTYYYLTVYDGCNTVTDSVHVQIDEADVNSITVIDAIGCAGSGTAQGSIVVDPNNPNWTYTLVGNSQTIGPGSIGVFNNLSGNIDYALTAMDENGCIFDSIIHVGLNATPVTADPVINVVDVTCLNADDGSAEVQNIGGGVNTPNLGPYNIVWSHTDGTIFTTTNVALGGGDIVNTLYGGDWQVVVTEVGSGCVWNDLFEIVEPELIQITGTPNEPNCHAANNGSVTVSADGGTLPYTFDITNTQGDILNIAGTNTANLLVTGWYYFEVSDANDCISNDSLFLSEPLPLEINSSTTDIICFGRNSGAIYIDTVLNYTGLYQDIAYYWDPDLTGSNPIGKNSQTGLPPGEYVVELHAGECVDQFTFFVKDTVEIKLDLGKDPAYCRTQSFQKGNGVVFGTATGGAGNFTFEWENVETGDKTTSTTWSALNPGNYKFTAKDQNNCIVSSVILLDSLNPIAAFTPVSIGFEGPGEFEGTEELEVEFENQSLYFANPNNPLADTTFKWNLFTNQDPGGSGNWFFSFNYDEKIDTSYFDEITYEVCLVAKNFNGCADTLCKEIVVHDFPELEVPNVFTPGQDPNNTFFFPNVGITEFECHIIDRYGLLVFQYTDISQAWDGNNIKNDKPCNDGVYFYTYTAKSSNGTPFSGEGTVTLIRDK